MRKRQGVWIRVDVVLTLNFLNTDKLNENCLETMDCKRNF